MHLQVAGIAWRILLVPEEEFNLISKRFEVVVQGQQTLSIDSGKF